MPITVEVIDKTDFSELEGEELPLAGDALDEVLAGIEGSLCEKAE